MLYEVITAQAILTAIEFVDERRRHLGFHNRPVQLERIERHTRQIDLEDAIASYNFV